MAFYVRTMCVLSGCVLVMGGHIFPLGRYPPVQFVQHDVRPVSYTHLHAVILLLGDGDEIILILVFHIHIKSGRSAGHTVDCLLYTSGSPYLLLPLTPRLSLLTVPGAIGSERCV